MTVRNPPVWIQAGTYTAEHDRLVTGMLTDRTTSNAGTFLGIERGVVPPLDQLQVTADGSMTVAISGGVVVVPREAADPPGSYICHNQGESTVTIPIASSHIRYDTIVARVNDSQQGDVGDVWLFDVIPGVEAPGATLPNADTIATSESATPIAFIRVIPAAMNGGTNKIVAAQVVDARTFVSGPGGIHLVWSRYPKASPGRAAYNVGEKKFYVSNGTTFEPMLTHAQWLAEQATYKVRQSYFGATLGITPDDVWDSTIDNVDTAGALSGGQNSPIQITGILVPKASGGTTGAMKIAIAAWGRNLGTPSAGHVSFEVRREDNNALIHSPAFGHGPSFYTTSWQTGYNEVLASNCPADIPLKVTVLFARSGSGGARSIFTRIRLTTTPLYS